MAKSVLEVEASTRRTRLLRQNYAISLVVFCSQPCFVANRIISTTPSHLGAGTQRGGKLPRPIKPAYHFPSTRGVLPSPLPQDAPANPFRPACDQAATACRPETFFRPSRVTMPRPISDSVLPPSIRLTTSSQTAFVITMSSRVTAAFSANALPSRVAPVSRPMDA